MTIEEQAGLVKLASPKLAGTTGELRDQALLAVAKALMDNKDAIFDANRQDMEQAEKDGIAAPVLKRLKFDEGKLRDVINGIHDLVQMPDPLFQTKLARELDEGLTLYRETCPIGVIGVIVSICIQGIVSGWMDVLSIYICPLGAGLAGIMFFWVCGKKYVEEQVNLGREKKFTDKFLPICKYVYCPICILVLILGIALGGIG